MAVDHRAGVRSRPEGYGHLSRWLAAIGPLQSPREPLSRSAEVDVCIVGAGFTGLWTAYELKLADPSLEVMVLEAEIAGFGASGRNGGWVLGELAGSREAWAKRAGRGPVLALGRAIADTVDEVGRVVEREGIACDFVRGGSLRVAQTPLQLQRLRAHVEEDRAWGMGPNDSTMLGADEALRRIAVDRTLGARYFAHCARVQPARLVRGLAEAAERHGVVIHEHTPVTAIEPGVVSTRAGVVRARQIVRATEGYTPKLPEYHRTLVPITSSMIATEALPEDVWRALRWDGGETLADAQHRYVYLQRTADGRVAIGGRGVPYRWGSVSDREGPPAAKTITALGSRLAELFPVLAGAPVAAAWEGVLGVPRDWSPAVGLDPATGLAWGGGYVGEGVAAANLAGRTLRDLLLGRDTELTRLPWVGGFSRDWEPEPLRFLGVTIVNTLLMNADRRERCTGRTALTARMARLIAGRNL
jgi:glycine/D-amino acid oxidase-like deaminating enzyme